ncbi:hypothetical protein LXL04_019619 [Taraxacum kok-saghyz]
MAAGCCVVLVAGEFAGMGWYCREGVPHLENEGRRRRSSLPLLDGCCFNRKRRQQKGRWSLFEQGKKRPRLLGGCDVAGKNGIRAAGSSSYRRR